MQARHLTESLGWKPGLAVVEAASCFRLADDDDDDGDDDDDDVETARDENDDDDDNDFC